MIRIFTLFLTFFFVTSLWAREPFTIVLDLDATGMVWLKNHEMENDFKDNKVVEVLDPAGGTIKKYAVVSGFPELIQSAFQLGARVVVYSAADARRNLSALTKIFLPDGRSALEAIGSENIYSSHFRVSPKLKPTSRSEVPKLAGGDLKKDLRLVTIEFRERFEREFAYQREKIKTQGIAFDEADIRRDVLNNLILDPENKLSDIDVSNVFLADDHAVNAYRGQERQLIWATELKDKTTLAVLDGVNPNSPGWQQSALLWSTNHNRIFLVAGLLARSLAMVKNGDAADLNSALWALQWSTKLATSGDVKHRLQELIDSGILEDGLNFLREFNSKLHIENPEERSKKGIQNKCSKFFGLATSLSIQNQRSLVKQLALSGSR